MEKKKKNQKKKLFKKKFKIIQKDAKENKNEEVLYEADKNEDIFHINNDENNNEENENRGISYNEEENNGNAQEQKEEKKDDVNNDAMSTSSNSIKDEISEFNDIPNDRENKEESDIFTIHTICVNHPNNNIDNTEVNEETNFQNESITQTGTNIQTTE